MSFKLKKTLLLIFSLASVAICAVAAYVFVYMLNPLLAWDDPERAAVYAYAAAGASIVAVNIIGLNIFIWRYAREKGR